MSDAVEGSPQSEPRSTTVPGHGDARPAAELPELLDVKEAARVLRCSPQHVRDLCNSKRLGHYRDASGAGPIFTTRSFIARYLQQTMVMPCKNEHDAAGQVSLATLDGRQRSQSRTDRPVHCPMQSSTKKQAKCNSSAFPQPTSMQPAICSEAATES